LIESAEIDDSTFSRVEPLLLNTELIKKVGDLYVLYNYFNPDEELENLFIKYKNKEEYAKYMSDIANDIGRSPNSIEKDAYPLAKKYGIKILSETR
jgi:hypothetical protein